MVGLLAEAVEPVHRHPHEGGLAAHLVDPHEPVPPVEGRVLLGLGHHGAAGLGEADHELGPELRDARGRVRQLRGDRGGPHGREVLRAAGLSRTGVAAGQGDDEVQGGLLVLGQFRARPVGGLDDHRPLLDGRGEPGLDVGAVPVHVDQQRADGAAELAARVVAQRHVGLADRHGDRDQPVHLGEQHAAHDLVLGLQQRRAEPSLAACHPLPQLVEAWQLRRVVEQAGHAQERVVAGGARAARAHGQSLVGLQDLLHHHPAAAGGAVQLLQVAAGGGQAVGVIDAEPLDEALVVEAQQQRVAGVEHRLVLHPDRGQGVDVEEPAVVQLLVAHLPVGQPVPLLVQQLVERQVLGAGPDREHVVVVRHHALGAAVDVALHHGDGGVGQLVADAAAQHRHEDGAGAGQVDVEPAREVRLGPRPQDVPERAVEPQRGGHRHVVGHHVHDDAQPVFAGRLGELTEPVLAPALGRDAAVVHHVVAVHGARGRLQDRGAEQVAHAQGGQIRHLRDGVLERERGVQLESVGGHGSG